jgi:anti-sigma factor RsiW
MMHTRIQEKLLLYVDGNLPAEQMQRIRAHLSVCSACAQQHDLLVSVWGSEIRREKLQPSPFLWTRIQAHIGEYERTPAFVWGFKRVVREIMLRPFAVPAAIAAIFVGVYLGTPHEPQRYERAQSVSHGVGAVDEFGLDQFDVLPPGALGSTLVNVSHTQK